MFVNRMKHFLDGRKFILLFDAIKDSQLKILSYTMDAVKPWKLFTKCTAHRPLVCIPANLTSLAILFYIQGQASFSLLCISFWLCLLWFNVFP